MRLRAHLLAALVVLLATATGCLSSSYQLSHAELERLAALSPDLRGRAVRVTQEFAPADASGPPRAGRRGPRLATNGPAILGGGAGGSHLGGAGGGHGGLSGLGSGVLGAGLGLLGLLHPIGHVVLASVGALATVGAASMNLARYTGTLVLASSEPLHLVADDGRESTVVLGELSPRDAAAADHATVDEGGRPRFPHGPAAPLDRRGGTTQTELLFGAMPTAAGGAVTPGWGLRTLLGGFATQVVGLGASAGFQSGAPAGAPSALYGTVGVDLQVMPFTWAGGDVSGGYAAFWSGDTFLPAPYVRAGLVGELPLGARTSLQVRRAGTRVDFGRAERALYLGELGVGVAAY